MYIPSIHPHRSLSGHISYCMIYSKKLDIMIINYCLCENKWFKWLFIRRSLHTYKYFLNLGNLSQIWFGLTRFRNHISVCIRNFIRPIAYSSSQALLVRFPVPKQLFEWALKIYIGRFQLEKFPSHYKLGITLYQIKQILVYIKFGHCSFEAAMSEWLVLWTRTNSIRVRSPSRWKLFQIMVA